MYLSWSAFYEGRTDALYFNVLIPRLLEDLLLKGGVRPCDVGTAPAVEFGLTSRAFEEAAREICERKEEFHILFVHSDLGGRGLEATVEERREALVNTAAEMCGFDSRCAVMLSPKKELEAWALADEGAVKSALGVTTIPGAVFPSSPQQVERLDDPKRTLEGIIQLVLKRGNKKSPQLLVRIAQDQNLDVLRRAPSFAAFEDSLVLALQNSGFIVAE